MERLSNTVYQLSIPDIHPHYLGFLVVEMGVKIYEMCDVNFRKQTIK